MNVSQLLAIWGCFFRAGDTVKIQVDVATRPSTMANHEFIVYGFTIEVDKLTLSPLRDSNGPVTNGQIITLTRVE